MTGVNLRIITWLQWGMLLSLWYSFSKNVLMLTQHGVNVALSITPIPLHALYGPQGDILED